MNNGHEDDKAIIDAAKALNKEKFTIADVYYAMHGKRAGRNQSRKCANPSPLRIRAALQRNGAQIVERGAKTARPLYSFFTAEEEDKQ